MRICASCNTLTHLGITQGSYLWTPARPSIPSCLTFSQTNRHSSLCPPPSVSVSPASWQDRQQLVRLGKLTSRTFTISTGAPHSCVLSPLFFSLYTIDCTSKDTSVKLLKFADGTTVNSLIKVGDESAYIKEVEHLADWCSLNLELNTQNCGDDSGLQEEPPCSPPTHHHGKHCSCSRVIQIPGNHHLSGLEVGQSHWFYCEKGQAETVFPPPMKSKLPQELLK